MPDERQPRSVGLKHPPKQVESSLIPWQTTVHIYSILRLMEYEGG